MSPWEIKLVVLKHEECLKLIIQNMTNLGVNSKSRKITVKESE